jgi:eukaryotic-like serine/threonine-protein kinase
MPLPGEILGDRYRLDDRIAAGGMGEVWQATDTVLGRDVAVKTLHAGRAGDPGFQTRFRHEARAMAVLHHPGVADVYDYGQSGPDAYIVMARVNGQALNERIAERGRLSAAETMSIVAQAGRALEAAHQAGIVHRDVKPGNLIIQPDGTVVLVDFGVARSAESAALTGAKEVVGTALYIAPEQVSKESTGPSADIYALGVVAYHCLAGHPPFLGDSAIAVAVQHVSDEAPPLPADVPPTVAAVVTRAMLKDPADRFPSAAAMADAAEQALSEQAATAGAGTTAILAATPAPARPAAPVSGHTAVLPAVLPGAGGVSPGPGGGRRRTPLLAALALVVLGTAVAVFAFVNGGLFPGSTPAESSTVKPGGANSPAATQTTGKRNNTNDDNDNKPAQNPASKPGTATSPATVSATPSKQPTTEATTTAPEETTATTAPAATTTTGDGGGDSGDNEGTSGGGNGSGGGDNSGTAGGEEVAATEAVATTAP